MIAEPTPNIEIRHEHKRNRELNKNTLSAVAKTQENREHQGDHKVYFYTKTVAITRDEHNIIRTATRDNNNPRFSLEQKQTITRMKGIVSETLTLTRTKNLGVY